MNVDIQLGRFKLNPRTRQLRVDGIDTPIGGRAFDLLLALVERHDRVVSAEELVELVWPDVAVEPNNLQVQIWALRKLLGHQSIATVARRGYRLAATAGVTSGRVGSARSASGDFDRNDAAGCDDPRHSPTNDNRASGTRDPGSARDELARRVRSHRIVTVTGGEAAVRRALVQSVARGLLNSLRGGVWHVEAAGLIDLLEASSPHEAPRTEGVRGPSIDRLARHESMLVLFDAERIPGSQWGLLVRAMAQAPLVRLLTSAAQPLGLPHEELVVMPAAQAHGGPAHPLPHGHPAHPVLLDRSAQRVTHDDPAQPAAHSMPRSLLRWRPRAR